MKRNHLSKSIAHSAWAMLLSLALFGCIAAAPIIMEAMDDKSTATLTVNRDAETLYADVVKSVKARGITTITKEDPDNFYLEGTRKGKKASLKIKSVESDKSQMVITIEEDEEKTALKEVVAATKEICSDLGLQCQEEKS